MITSFKGEYRFLSNFWPVTVFMDGEYYDTVEHAYCAAKTLDLEARKVFQQEDLSPGEAKRYGRKLVLRPDWEEVKLGVMEALLRRKFMYQGLATKLKATGDQELIEGNTWGDRFWGQYRGTGDNHLGKLLMKLRQELKDGRDLV